MTEEATDRTPFDGAIVIDGKPTAVRWQFEGEGRTAGFVAYTAKGELLKIPLHSRYAFNVDWPFIQRASSGVPFRVGFEKGDWRAGPAGQ